MNNIYFTNQGIEKVKKEYEELILKRKDAVYTLKRAREMGDLSENGLYKAAKFELGNIDRNIRRVKFFLTKGKVTNTPQKGVIGIGSKIIINDNTGKREFNIVGNYESNPSENKISHISPLGKALLNKKVGETIEIKTPSGKRTYKILKVS